MSGASGAGEGTADAADADRAGTGDRAADVDRTGAGDRAADVDRTGAGDRTADAGLVVVRAPLPGTFYRAPRPGAEPFVEVGSRVDEETVVGIVETMKLFNPVHAGTRGQVAEICVGDAEFTPGSGALVRIRADQ